MNAIIKMLADKTIMPTDLPSAALSDLPKEIRQMSIFSARTTSAVYLAKVQKVLQDFAAGKINMATAKMELQQALRDMGYTPDGGFPGETKVPPANTILQNLASDKRITLVVETLVSRAQGTAYAQAGMAPSRLYQYPCWELVRVFWKKHPRGSTDREGDLSWQERWLQCGGKLYEGRMIAKKDDDIWEELGDSGKFSDGMDSDTGPYWFNSGARQAERSRAVCIALGVIDPGEGQAARKISLLGQMFKDPAKATLGDITAKRSAILDALKSLEEAA